MKAKDSRKEWAVRCFHKLISDDLEIRYQHIYSFLQAHPSARFLYIDYLRQGIAVRNSWYPVVKMEWCNGKTLNHYIESIIASNPSKLKFLRNDFADLIRELQQLGIAHGDLQHGNILVTDKLVLVDYDGMYIPGTGLTSGELGQVNYQHPGRDETYFNERLDRFSSIVIYLALLALETNPSLWAQFNTGDNILFKQSDFVQPHRSDLLRCLCAYDSLRTLAESFIRVCQGPVTSVPSLDEFLAIERITVSPEPVVNAPRKLRRQYPVVDSRDGEALRRHQGDVVEIFGRVSQQINNFIPGNREPYVILHFDNPWPSSTARVVIWGRVGDETVHKRFPANQMAGRYVSVVGLLGMCSGYAIPEIQLESEDSIMVRALTSQQVAELQEYLRHSTISAPLQNRDKASNEQLLGQLTNMGDSTKILSSPGSARNVSTTPIQIQVGGLPASTSTTVPSSVPRFSGQSLPSSRSTTRPSTSRPTSTAHTTRQVITIGNSTAEGQRTSSHNIQSAVISTFLKILFRRK